MLCMGMEELLKEITKPEYTAPILYFFSAASQIIAAIIGVILTVIYVIIPFIHSDKKPKYESNILSFFLKRDRTLQFCIGSGFISIGLSLIAIVYIYLSATITNIIIIYILVIANIVSIILCFYYVYNFVINVSEKYLNIFTFYKYEFSNFVKVNYRHKILSRFLELSIYCNILDFDEMYLRYYIDKFIHVIQPEVNNDNYEVIIDLLNNIENDFLLIRDSTHTEEQYYRLVHLIFYLFVRINTTPKRNIIRIALSNFLQRVREKEEESIYNAINDTYINTIRINVSIISYTPQQLIDKTSIYLDMLIHDLVFILVNYQNYQQINLEALHKYFKYIIDKHYNELMLSMTIYKNYILLSIYELLCIIKSKNKINEYESIVFTRIKDYYQIPNANLDIFSECLFNNIEDTCFVFGLMFILLDKPPKNCFHNIFNDKKFKIISINKNRLGKCLKHLTTCFNLSIDNKNIDEFFNDWSPHILQNNIETDLVKEEIIEKSQ